MQTILSEGSNAVPEPPRLDAEVIIIGAGFAGLGMAIRMKQRGMSSFLVLERASDVGGTWRDNRYPGCACDIPSVLYSFSFERDATWTRVFPRQGEILDYLRRCADKYRIRSHIRFDTELLDAAYDEPSATWRLRTSGGSTLTSRVLICAMGPLNRPNIPNLPGIDRFAGPSFHSSQWDAAVDLRDKHVAVIGTGASAIQIVPEIAPVVRKLTLFQRSAPWVIPRNDGAISPLQRFLRRWLPGYSWAVRTLIYWVLEIRAFGFTVKPALLQSRESLALKYLERQIPEPELRRAVTPNYRLGCKRVLISDDYYPALRRPNVEVVPAPVAELREHSVVTASGAEYPADVVIFATGFRATQGFGALRVYGRGGKELADAWRDGMEAYLGTSIAGFPNLFTLIGPNTGLGHNSMVVMMEAQYSYVLDALAQMRRDGLRALDVKPAVQQRFNERLQARMRRTVWASGCTSWYIDARGKNTTLWPGFTFAYRYLTQRFRPDRYERW
ncbi:MAG: NAD(P)/FAD-dependent oxidoreductase [Candidatus Eremiobacteraeota bacterium]|nr:NAD(P)/FAD-dependent oxidoreductase [Candidatus Eremiobacteraeota bacterium]